MRVAIGTVAALIIATGTAGAQKTVCDSPCKEILLPLTAQKSLPVPNSNPLSELQSKVTGANVACDSPCKLLLLPLVPQGGGTRQKKLPFIVETVPARDMPVMNQAFYLRNFYLLVVALPPF
jgi:hypothetical protein